MTDLGLGDWSPSGSLSLPRAQDLETCIIANELNDDIAHH